MCELSAKEQDLRAVVNPDQENDERRRCAVSRCQGRMAPIKSDRHFARRKQKGRVSGMNLKMSANRIAMMPKEKTAFTDCKRRTDRRSKLLTNLSAVDRVAVTIRDVSNRNPVAMTRPVEKNRCLKVTIQKFLVLLRACGDWWPRRCLDVSRSGPKFPLYAAFPFDAPRRFPG
jgi:hypothetical protein